MLKLRTVEQLSEQFGKSNELRQAYESSPALMEQFVQYIVKTFATKNAKSAITTAISVIKYAKNDLQVVMHFRTYIDGKDPAELLERERSYYAHAITSKLRTMEAVGLKGPLGTYVDIGTEREQFLDAVWAKFGCSACLGYNIQTGFNHYGTDFGNNKRIKFYDGVNFGVKSEFDTVSVISVIHHMPPENFAQWCRSLYAACKWNAKVYIKDVNLTDLVHKVTFRYQHYLYEGILIPGTDYSYMNAELTLSFLRKHMEDAGFKLLVYKPMHNFNNTYNALFIKVKGG